MAYVQSSNINVFPSTRRTYHQDFSARLMTEQSIARIINTLIDKDGFVISSDINNNSFEFNIYGYYFQVKYFNTFLNDTFNNATDVYAAILIDQTDHAFNELYVPAESTDTPFQGVTFTTITDLPTPTEDQILKYIKIAHRDSVDTPQWEVAPESKQKLDFDSLTITSIDGGIV